MKKYLVIIIACFPFVLMAKDVKVDRAIIVAQNWYNHYAPYEKKGAKITSKQEYKRAEKTSFYIFSFDKGGFVMVSANDLAEPIIGYGFEGKVPQEINNPSVKALFDNYSHQIDTLDNINLKSANVNPKWETIEKGIFLKSAGRSVGPLLTTTWDQGWPYNAMCPDDPNGPGGHTMAGCGAIALSQIMYYHKWPKTGSGRLSYKSYCNLLLETDFSEEINWIDMKDTINSFNQAVADLIFKVGKSIGSDFGSYETRLSITIGGGLGENLVEKTQIENSLTNFFKYNIDSIKGITYLKNNSSEFINILKSEIRSKNPVLIGGQNDLSIGHAFVCDGMADNNFFHFNCGWGGFYDGFYLLDDTYPNGLNFSDWSYMIYGIRPDSSSIYIEKDSDIGNIDLVDKNLVVSRGVNLTINPGSLLRFNSKSGLYVFGGINSIGNENNRIVLTELNSNEGWKGIQIFNGYLSGYCSIDEQMPNKLKFTEISYSNGTGLDIISQPQQPIGVNISDCYFSNNKKFGVYTNHSNLSITRSSFAKNTDCDIIMVVYFDNSKQIIDANNFENNKISIRTTDLNFSNNKVSKNSKISISYSNAKLSSNYFWGNSQPLYVHESNVTVVNNLFVYNFKPLFSYNSTFKIINNTFSQNSRTMRICRNDFNPLIVNIKDSLINNIIDGGNIQFEGNCKLFISNCLINNGINGLTNLTPYPLNDFEVHDIIDGKPNFINPLNFGYNENINIELDSFNWNLDSLSCAIDMGNLDLALNLLPEKDLKGESRINGKIDIGAYETTIKQSKKPIILNNPSSKKICESSTFLLNTEVKGDSLEYEWYFNEEKLNGTIGDKLKFDDIKTSNAGKYYCIISNKYGVDTSNIASVEVIESKMPNKIEIECLDTICWFQKISASTNNIPDAKYKFNVLGNEFFSQFPYVNYTVKHTDSIELITAEAQSLCGEIVTTQKKIVIKPISLDRPIGIVYGPSVVYKGEIVSYFYDLQFEKYDLSPNYNHPYGFINLGGNTHQGINYEVDTIINKKVYFRFNWDNIFSGAFIVLPIKVVDSAEMLPVIQETKSINNNEVILSYSIDSLFPATSYDWVIPEGLLPVGSVTNRKIDLKVSPNFKGGVIKVRGTNQNWIGVYYEKNIENVTSSQFSVQIDRSFNLFPNPSSGEVMINLDELPNRKIEVSVIDLNGRKIYSKDFEPMKNLKLDLNKLSSGFYFIEIKSGDFQAIKKIVIRDF